MGNCLSFLRKREIEPETKIENENENKASNEPENVENASDSDKVDENNVLELLNAELKERFNDKNQLFTPESKIKFDVHLKPSKKCKLPTRRLSTIEGI